MISASPSSFIPSSHTRTPFAQVARPFISDPRINLREFRVYSALKTFPTNQEGERWPSRATLSLLTGLPPKIISRTTSRLQELGWLVKFGDGGRSKTSRYLVFDQAQPPEVILSFHLGNSPPAQDALPVNPPQIEPSPLPKGGQNEEGQEVDYLTSPDKREVATEPEQIEPAPQAQAPLSGSLCKTKTTVPDTIPDVWLEQAAIQRPDLPKDIIIKSAGVFLDHHRSKGSMMVDWSAAFRVWIARERTPKADVARPQTPPRYKPFNEPEKPVAPDVQASWDYSEQRRLEMLRQHGIDPKTGLKKADPPLPPSRPLSLPDNPPPLPGTQEYQRQFEENRRYQLEQLKRLIEGTRG